MSTCPATTTVAEVRDFAVQQIAYEAIHAHGPDTPLRLAIARDLLAIVGCPTCVSGTNRELVGMVCQTCGTDYGSPAQAVEPADCTDHASNFLLPDGRYQCLMCSLRFIGCEPCGTSGRWTLMYGEGDNGECPACNGTGAATEDPIGGVA